MRVVANAESIRSEIGFMVIGWRHGREIVGWIKDSGLGMAEGEKRSWAQWMTP